MERNGRFTSFAICIAASALAACASTPDPKPEIQSARALVEQAEQSGAAEFAGKDLETARDRLRLAEDADEAHKDDDAQRYAGEASVNAKLAIANTAAAKAERGAVENMEGVDALRDEANRPEPESERPDACKERIMTTKHTWLTRISSVAALALLVGCASNPTTTAELERARDAVDKVASMPDSSTLASAELKEAQETLRKAEEAARENEPDAEVAHLAYVAEQQAAIAEAKMNEAKALEDTKNAEADRNAALLEARERDVAQAERRADQAEADAAAAWREVEEAQETARGLVLTFGDMLFDTGGSTLKPGAQLLLDKLAAYLQQNPGAHAIIEGHTDNTGSDAMNQALSERRAAAVAAALQARGITGDRLETVGLGESYPVATNDTSAGREENRRVEVVLSDSEGVFVESARRTASTR